MTSRTATLVSLCCVATLAIVGAQVPTAARLEVASIRRYMTGEGAGGGVVS
jgi:hypothetical protein